MEENIGTAIEQLWDGQPETDNFFIPKNDIVPRNPAISPKSGVIIRKDPMIMAPLDPMFEENLNEEIKNVLYHYTSAWNFLNILKERKIFLTVATGHDIYSGGDNKRVFFLSTTRSKLGHYTLVHKDSTTGVVLVLNRDFLERNNSIKPVDYWGRDFRMINPRRNEMEERILSNKPFISLPEPASDLIIEAHMIIKPDTDERYTDIIKYVIIYSRKLGIPLYIYRDNGSWLYQDKRNALPNDQLISFIKSLSKKEEEKWPQYTRRSPFDVYMELFYKNDYNQLSKAAKDKIGRIAPYYLMDAYKSLESDIHNSRSPNSRGYSDLIKFVQFLQKQRLNPKQFIDILSDKWYNRKDYGN